MNLASCTWERGWGLGRKEVKNGYTVSSLRVWAKYFWIYQHSRAGQLGIKENWEIPALHEGCNSLCDFRCLASLCLKLRFFAWELVRNVGSTKQGLCLTCPLVAPAWECSFSLLAPAFPSVNWGPVRSAQWFTHILTLDTMSPDISIS